MKTQSSLTKKYIVGIDEVGRGPLAGPVAVGALVLSPEVEESFFEKLKDSKKLSSQKRDQWFAKIADRVARKQIKYAVTFVSHELIDRHGIAWAIRKALRVCLYKLELDPEECEIMLDGGLRAPRHYPLQKTIINGDATVPVIALASIVAKVLRDRKMERLALRFPHYDFYENKGYGTPTHLRALKLHGPSEIHRRSFLTRVL